MKFYLQENDIQRSLEKISQTLKQAKVKETNSFLTAAIHNAKALQGFSGKVAKMVAPIAPFVKFFQFSVIIRAAAVSMVSGQGMHFFSFSDAKAYLDRVQLTPIQKIISAIIMAYIDYIQNTLMVHALFPLADKLASSTDKCLKKSISLSLPYAITGFTEEASKYVAVKAKFLTQYQIVFNAAEFSLYVTQYGMREPAVAGLVSKLASKFKLSTSIIQSVTDMVKRVVNDNFIQYIRKGMESFGLKATVVNASNLNTETVKSSNEEVNFYYIVSLRSLMVLLHLFWGLLHKYGLTPVAVAFHVLWNVFISSILTCRDLERSKTN